MKQFNVLHRDQPIYQHYLLEASAGTGKTFSIQNIVVRLLIESHEDKSPLQIHEILLVTFTRAATQDLKLRIRSNIEQSLSFLSRWEKENSFDPSIPDYLNACIEKGEEFVKQAIKWLQHALFTFDQAQIFTIHSFCARMLRQFALEGDMGLYFSGGEDPLPQSKVMSLIHDYFRTGVRNDSFSPSQLDIILKKDPQQKTLLRLIQKGSNYPTYPLFKEVCKQLYDKLNVLKDKFSLNSEKIIEDFQSQANGYRSYKTGETKAQTFEKIVRFAKLFDREEWGLIEIEVLIEDGLVWVEALDPKLVKGKLPKSEDLHFPGLTEYLQAHFRPLIDEARDSTILLARMASECQQLLKRYQKEEEKLSPDDILRKMHEALTHLPFLHKVQSNFQAAIIDEFQDTDPLQWKIFKTLFLSDQNRWSGFLYLVGDPKQSIYSFRQADIYTYLAAAQAIGEKQCFSLNVNYRSQPRLVQALNGLFATEHIPQFFPLPKQSRFLSYTSVQAGHTHLDQQFNQRGAMHFFVGNGATFHKPKFNDLETQIFFPFIAREVMHLRNHYHLKFHQFAVLVRDRHQALRLAEYFDLQGIPYLNQRGTSLANSIAHRTLIDLLHAIFHPHDRGALRILLGSSLMGWTHEEVKKEGAIEFALFMIQQLRVILLTQDFAFFFQKMLHTICRQTGTTILEQILSREGGRDFFRDLQQISDLIVEHHSIEWNSPEQIISFLDQLQVWEEDEDSRIKRFQDSTVEGVRILTLHFSKGLEFDIVFALGLVNRTGVREDFIPVETGDILTFVPASEETKEYQDYCEECDAEKMRQLYVSLTRAKLQLYIPIALNLPSEKVKWGDASPMDIFLACFDQPSPPSYSVLYERIRHETGKNLLAYLETSGKENHISFSINDQALDEPMTENRVIIAPLLQGPARVKVSVKPLWMTSFTILSKNLEYKSLLLPTPQDYTTDIKTIHTLPASREIGTLIHSILEKISFSNFKKLKNGEDKFNLISNLVQQSSYREWEDVIIELISNVLLTPLSVKTGSFCLADLDMHDIFREMPFIFPFLPGQKIEELEYKEGMIKGVIDLIFSHEGRYYLLDWKTNWLGPSLEDYERSSLLHSMQSHAYFLQGAIYTEALKRFLQVVERRPFEECFGGVFYLFLRGIHPKNNQSGIYHFV